MSRSTGPAGEEAGRSFLVWRQRFCHACSYKFSSLEYPLDIRKGPFGREMSAESLKDLRHCLGWIYANAPDELSVITAQALAMLADQVSRPAGITDEGGWVPDLPGLKEALDRLLEEGFRGLGREVREEVLATVRDAAVAAGLLSCEADQPAPERGPRRDR